MTTRHLSDDEPFHRVDSSLVSQVCLLEGLVQVDRTEAKVHAMPVLAFRPSGEWVVVLSHKVLRSDKFSEVTGRCVSSVAINHCVAHPILQSLPMPAPTMHGTSVVGNVEYESNRE